MRCIIAGCRSFEDYDRLFKVLLHLFSRSMPDEIVCGMGRGTDLLGKRWAIEHRIPIHEFPADWVRFGKIAGPKRNQQMADHATHLVAFWDGRSSGTKDMIDRATTAGLQIRIVDISPSSIKTT